jgi:predicted outer membrane repeat protein
MLMKLLRKRGNTTPARTARRLINCWPPFWGAGITVRTISADYRYIRVILKRTWFNRNYVGTQFGGAIYAMTDPFYMWMIMNNLGSDYIVWDKAAYIDFISPGKTALIADFSLEQSTIDRIKEKTATGQKYIFDLPVTIKNTNGEIVAKVIKTLYVRKKKGH